MDCLKGENSLLGLMLKQCFRKHLGKVDRQELGKDYRRRRKLHRTALFAVPGLDNFLCSPHESNFYRMHLYSYLFSKCVSPMEKFLDVICLSSTVFCVHCITASWQMALLGADKIITLRQTINAIHFNA